MEEETVLCPPPLSVGLPRADSEKLDLSHTSFVTFIARVILSGRGKPQPCLCLLLNQRLACCSLTVVKNRLEEKKKRKFTARAAYARKSPPFKPHQVIKVASGAYISPYSVGPCVRRFVRRPRRPRRPQQRCRAQPPYRSWHGAAIRHLQRH